MMHIVFSSFLTLAAMLFGGTAFLSMESTMDQMVTASSCSSENLGVMQHADGCGVDCLGHCISAVSPASALPVPLNVLALLVCFLVVSIRANAFASEDLALREKWREGIGKYLVHQRLSTVMLRE